MSEVTNLVGLGAIRFVDGTTRLPIGEPLELSAPGVRLARTRQGWYAIVATPALDADRAAHPRRKRPAPGSTPLAMEVRDPAGAYLPRRFTVSYPRDPDIAHAAQPNALFLPADVALFRSPAARTAANWALIRASVRHKTTHDPLAGALIRVVRRRAPGELLARGMSDARGEALVAVPGIPITTWEETGSRVLATEVEVQLQVVWDPRSADLPDPDDLEKRQARLRVRTADVTLASGRLLVQAL
jgi:hypothetical protein